MLCDGARQQGQVSRVPRRVRVAAEPSAQAFLLYSSRQLAWIRWPQSSAVAPSPRSSKHTGHASTRGCARPRAQSAAAQASRDSRDARNASLSIVQATLAGAQKAIAKSGGALRQFVRSPGLLADPYRGEDPPQPWADLVAVAGWRERGRRWLKSLQSVYTLAKCTRDCKPSFSLPAFKTEAGGLYEDVSRLIAEGDRTRLRHLVGSWGASLDAVGSALLEASASGERGGGFGNIAKFLSLFVVVVVVVADS